MAEVLGAKPSLRRQTQEQFPVQAGIQAVDETIDINSWTPAFAGVTTTFSTAC
jgi:hypothetical protein